MLSSDDNSNVEPDDNLEDKKVEHEDNADSADDVETDDSQDDNTGDDDSISTAQEEKEKKKKAEDEEKEKRTKKSEKNIIGSYFRQVGTGDIKAEEIPEKWARDAVQEKIKSLKVQGQKTPSEADEIVKRTKTELVIDDFKKELSDEKKALFEQKLEEFKTTQSLDQAFENAKLIADDSEVKAAEERGAVRKNATLPPPSSKTPEGKKVYKWSFLNSPECSQKEYNRIADLEEEGKVVIEED